MGKSLDDKLRHCIDILTHLGGIHDMDIWYSIIKVRMHCLDVAMGIGTLVLFIGKVDCIMLDY
jgi:hypothetical protein